MSITTPIKAALCAGLLALGGGQAYGQEATMITLKSLDGTVVITGALQGMEAGYYSIVVAGMGLIRVPQDMVTCSSTSIDCAALASS